MKPECCVLPNDSSQASCGEVSCCLLNKTLKQMFCPLHMELQPSQAIMSPVGGWVGVDSTPTIPPTHAATVSRKALHQLAEPKSGRLFWDLGNPDFMPIWQGFLIITGRWAGGGLGHQTTFRISATPAGQHHPFVFQPMVR